MSTYTTFDAPGLLHAGIWEPAGEPAGTLVAVHGITSSHKAWAALARELPQWRIIAPDLRGRGLSNHLVGPYGMSRHADDVAALLAHLGVGRVLPVGHSMGAFVSVVLAHRHPQLMDRLVLVDGGIPLQLPDGVDPQAGVEAVLGPAAERLQRTYPSLEAYEAEWRRHPAMAEWNDDLSAYVAYDLHGEPPRMHAATRYGAMAEDTLDVAGEDTDLTRALDAIDLPVLLLRAERGMFDQSGGLYSDAWLDGWRARVPSLTVREVPGVNHYTIAMLPRGAAVVADAVRVPVTQSS
ncbi:alpha/beta hydrolase [Tessaracoccus rhinocerotis]|uniref:Alpha/beta hydrolase n=1 Tax=Tessaracoccus rhinocerotis TaxID=1689449 RepID=A0A553K0P9_9ACTN|nr:alpha/beta hydrolase [Tessaracoccus rhinocerotis]TRY18278.1 alpha/beta hydrolase [Tessaracoccus rhinocerotis]